MAMTFSQQAVEETVEELINGRDYRGFVVNAINMEFLDFTIKFFKEIIDAKYNNENLDLEWYKERFINSKLVLPEEAAIYAGINKKTITNIYGTAKKEMVIDIANQNFDYLSSIIGELEVDFHEGLSIKITLTYNNVSVDLDLKESLLVINALATKKIALRGGAWSSIGKKVEKPLLDKLCELVGVPSINIDNSTFSQDRTLAYDREVDYKLISRTGVNYRVEVKLMGKGNPESADVIHARDSHIFVADTLSEQNKAQFVYNNVAYLELKGKTQIEIIRNYKMILDRLDIPHN